MFKDSATPKRDIFALHGQNLIQDYIRLKDARLPVGGPGAARVPSSFATRAARKLVSAPSSGVTPSTTLPVGILGAGVGGLYTALCLEDLGIPYRIIEARKEVGGRLFTYKFPDATGAPYNYFDVGAMRFPKIDAMRRVFKLFSYPPLNTGGKFDLESRLQPFYFKGARNNNTFYSYNEETIVQNALTPQDTFKAREVIQDTTSAELYITAGTKAIVDDVIDPFATRLLEDLKTGGNEGWEYMKKFDKHSTRSYMALEYKPTGSLGLPDKPLPTDVINWCETFDKSTGWYDRALSETVLEAVAFGWSPGRNPPPTPWFCIDGGSQQIARVMADYILSKNPNAIMFEKTVTGIAKVDGGMEVTTDDKDVHKFSHVISTLPLPVLRTFDLRKAGLSPMQTNALRDLNYGPSIKIGLQFKRAWWTLNKDKSGRPLNIIGGQTYTDRPLRTVVYPSFGDVMAGKTTTLIASYCWTEDATRLGSLIGKDDERLKALVLRELAEIHNVEVNDLYKELIDLFAWDWTHNRYTMGAFAFFGPGKFGNIYTSLNSPAAGGLLHFAGEAISVRHAWVEGALDSAWRAVAEMLILYGSPEEQKELQQKFRDNWGMNSEWLVPPSAAKVPDTAPPTTPKPAFPIHKRVPAPVPEEFPLRNSLLFDHIVVNSQDWDLDDGDDSDQDVI